MFEALFSCLGYEKKKKEEYSAIPKRKISESVQSITNNQGTSNKNPFDIPKSPEPSGLDLSSECNCCCCDCKENK